MQQPNVAGVSCRLSKVRGATTRTLVRCVCATACLGHVLYAAVRTYVYSGRVACLTDEHVVNVHT
jgi:hypothetical protein